MSSSFIIFSNNFSPHFIKENKKLRQSGYWESGAGVRAQE